MGDFPKFSHIFVMADSLHAVANDFNKLYIVLVIIMFFLNHCVYKKTESDCF